MRHGEILSMTNTFPNEQRIMVPETVVRRFSMGERA